MVRIETKITALRLFRFIVPSLFVLGDIAKKRDANVRLKKRGFTLKAYKPFTDLDLKEHRD